MSISRSVVGIVASACFVQAAAASAPAGWTSWVAHFVAFATAPASLSLQGPDIPGALVSLVPLGPDHAKPDHAAGCAGNFSLRDGGPPFVVSAQAVVLGATGQDCSRGRLALLLIGIRGADSEAAKSLAASLTAALNRPPQVLNNGRNRDLHWQLTSVAAVEIGSSKDEKGELQLRFAHSLSKDRPAE